MRTFAATLRRTVARSDRRSVARGLHAVAGAIGRRARRDGQQVLHGLPQRRANARRTSCSRIRTSRIPAADRAKWEAVLHKLSAGLMPPPGEPRPSDDDIASFVSYLETTLDADRGPSRPARPCAG